MVDREPKGPWVARTRREAEEWTLVLTAAGIPSTIRKTQGGWALVVAWRDEEPATRELAAFQEENQATSESTAGGLEYGRSYAGFMIAACLLGFYFITGPRNPAVTWFRQGSASAEEILAGEIWRAVTALTLHADPPHVLGNAASCAVFVTALCRQLGPGLGPSLVLLAGAIGNAMNAFAHGAHHTSIGASTALFGAIGIMAGLQFTTRWRRVSRRPRPWVPLAAGLALLAMLGTGTSADVAAHLFGFAAGAPLGATAAVALRRPPRTVAQWVLALTAAVTVLGSWFMALLS
jgi:rhomboid protease GluP